MTKFLLLLGPSGVGKSTVIQELKALDERYIYISPYMTRELREGEKDKHSVTDAEFDQMEFVFVNEKYGVRYGTPKQPIVSALEANNFPVLDWPYDKLQDMRALFPVFVCYFQAPTQLELARRLEIDGRAGVSDRFSKAMDEFDLFKDGSEAKRIGVDLFLEIHTGKTAEIARQIHSAYTAG